MARPVRFYRIANGSKGSESSESSERSESIVAVSSPIAVDKARDSSRG